MKAKNLSEWRRTILERDNYTCIICGSKDNLVVDHIKPRRSYPELVLQTTNGRVLCHKCHSRFGDKIKRPPGSYLEIDFANSNYSQNIHYRFHWPKTLVEKGYTGSLKIYETPSCLVIPKPDISNKSLKENLITLALLFELKAEVGHILPDKEIFKAGKFENQWT
jgi:hypothetical protein